MKICAFSVAAVGAVATDLGANVSGFPACNFDACSNFADAPLSGYPATCYASKACGAMDCSSSYKVTDKQHYCQYDAKDRHNQCMNECSKAGHDDWVKDCKNGCGYWNSGDCSATSTNGDWIAHETIQAEVKYKYQHGTAKSHSESKTNAWSQSVTHTVSSRFMFGHKSTSSSIGSATVDSYSQEWSANTLSSYSVKFKDKDDGKQLWQYVITISDDCSHTEKTYTRDYALTAGKWQKPCCPAGYGDSGHQSDYQKCHSPATKASWCSSDAEHFTLV